jgi:hypothetical protein
MQTVEGEPLLRIPFAAAERIRDPDVEGTIYVDPATFQVRRTVMRLTRISRALRPTEEFEVITDFREIMPSIPVIFRTESVERLDPNSDRKFDRAFETQTLAGYQFTKRKPGDDVGRKP